MDLPKPIRSLQTKSRNREALKPAELIQISGHHELTLNARRAITILWHHAHIQGVADGKDYTIEIDDLKADRHKGYERVEDAITALMRAILTVKMPGGRTTRVQFLGGNNLDDPDRAGRRADLQLRQAPDRDPEDLDHLGQDHPARPDGLHLEIRRQPLRERVADDGARAEAVQGFTLDEFRDMLGVQPGRYKTFGELNKHVLQPAVAEVNALAPFSISVLPVKQGKRVASVNVGWGQRIRRPERSLRGIAAPKIGRRARINGTVEHVCQPAAVRRTHDPRRPASSTLPPKPHSWR